ncbi:AAA family ATPase [Candidatus Venteria ishoeyi]|uniref:Recombination protein F n=1 Tax=Candidatus Venteria ishoeyi TaxID=1899563 RepID=A0A1H6FB24_9GAMM|nr:AAA family ATPase [Candidatus Venteria ishoeyi]SEH06529.1 recombination protein F [Candidatus Venteria ishoeyi]
MRLKKITLENFRCYQHLEIDLHANITVLVANNGEGKTAILDAIRIALWPFVSQFDLAKPAYADPANTIMIDDVSIVKSVQQTSNTFGALDKMARQLPASICATSNDSTWQRYRDSETKRSQTKDDAGTKVLKTYAKGVQKAIRNLSEPAQTLPVFGYYGTGRLWREKRLTDGKKGTTETTNQQIRTVAYRDCLDPASSFKQFEEWFTAAYFDVRDYQTNQLLETGIMHIEVPEALIMPIKVVQEAVNQVLAPVGWHSLQYGGEKYDKSLVLKHPKYGVMKISQLSDGIKNMLAMIADIAYRCILLNTHLQENAAKTSPGVVLIDEVDMHLHPQWQQTVIAALRQAFPEIQFIVTTHSPQVLSTVPSESIRIIQHELNSDTNQIISTANLPLKQSRGVASADVMAELQLVDPIPDVEEAHWLTQYKQLITQGEHESDQGEALKEKIIKHFGESHQEWLECGRLIRLQVMKAKLPKRNQ